MKKLNTNSFIEKAKQLHGDSFNYDKVVYTNSYGKVTINCPVHGDFEQRPNDHLMGKKCPKCSKNFKLTTSTFIEKVQEVHSNKYDYSKVNYVNRQTKVTITCPIHGDFEQVPDYHIHGNGCPVCGGSIKIGADEFIRKSKIIHNDYYDYSKVVYKNNNKKVIIICPKHGEFTQVPKSHLNGNKCSKCAESCFDFTKPAILYYLKINGGQAYKIGITNRTVNERFNKSELQVIEVLATRYYEIGEAAYVAEQEVLSDYLEHKYVGPKLLESGNTELFNKDILGLDTSTL